MALNLEITDSPQSNDLSRVSDGVRAHNIDFMPNDFRELAIFARDSTGNIIAGLTATTYWQRLDIKYLWVDPACRGSGISKALLLSAENEALQRGCQFSQVDTFDFQALGLYQKMGYQVFGELVGYENGHKRFYLQKPLLAI